MWLASVDGAISPVQEALIPVADDGVLRGDGGFEVLRVYGGRPFALEDHFARLGRTCAGLRLAPDLDALRAEALVLLAGAGEPESLLRLVVTRGGRASAAPTRRSSSRRTGACSRARRGRSSGRAAGACTRLRWRTGSWTRSRAAACWRRWR